MITSRKIELLAPAKNAEIGIEAILHGADAVYIGAPKFGARVAAGNSIEDIERLTKFAHQFHARVYVALNTILYDDELSETEKIIVQLYEKGVDALIVQDMGILQLNLPPIPLHASTQMDNRTVEKAKFLEKAGFSQIVLARELSIETIRDIASAVKTPLEVFVHGALCVSFSGQCYLSNALNGRSANRGNCSQPCRLPYNLVDSNGAIVASNKHLLSMKDLNRSADLEELLDAGVTSLKIEGRLKELSYVKNVVAFYRQRLDEIFAQRPEFIRASSGKSTYTFAPSLQKSFNRDFTTYFLHGRGEKVWSFDSPKSIGEFVGTVSEVTTKFIRLNTKVKLNNADGLCFFNHKKELEGIHVNRVEGDLIYPFQLPEIKKGTKVYRNNDHEFESVLSKKSAERKIAVCVQLSETLNGFSLRMEDEDGFFVERQFQAKKEIAQKDQTLNIQTNIGKTGDTIFVVASVEIHFSQSWFIPASFLSQWRREVAGELLQIRLRNHPQPKVEHQATAHAFPSKEISYLGNIANEKAKSFYVQHQSDVMQKAFEIEPQSDVPLMFTCHCVKFAMGWCPINHKVKHLYKEPFFLTYQQTKLRLEFDCKQCQMKVYKEEINA